MTKKLLFLTLYLIFSVLNLNAQVTSTENFETEPSGATSFTDNGQVFNITSQAGGSFDIYSSSSLYGWNGTSTDYRFIDNTGTASFNIPLQLTISSSGATPFKLNSMWLFLSQSNLSSLGVGGSLTLVGKLAGNIQYTATANSGFNTSIGVANGFTLINLSNFGGQNNANTVIDEIVISTGGSFAYISVDAFTWTTVPSITATTSQTNVSCNGGSNGSATVTPSGGTTPYTYSWSPSGGTAATATGLSAGTYTCTITDATSNSITKNFTITQPSAITVTAASQTNISCNGGSNGSASINTPIGGAGGYTYNWTPGNPTGDGTTSVTGLTAGTWTCTVTDANACTSTQNFTITQPTAINTATAAQTNVSCNGGSNGSASVTPSGGAGGYTYSWSPSGGTAATATGLSAGTYTVTVTDANACTATRNFTITQPTAINTATATQTNVSCNGGSNGSASVTPSGGAGGYTYSWSPSGGTAATATGLSAGTYTVTVTDANACTATRNFTITQPTALTATTAQTNVACNGGTNGSATVFASGGTPSYTYSWSPSGGTNATATGLAAGTYTCTITDANSCTTTNNVTITQPSALLASLASQTNVSCNGSTNGSASIIVTGGTPPYIYSWSPSGGTSATATDLSAGLYTCTITDANSCTTTNNVTITQPNVMTVDAGPATMTYCTDAITPITATNTSTNFQGAYAPANWTFANVNADGNVNTTNAPASITITGGNNHGTTIGNSGDTSYSITFTSNATVSFNWANSTNTNDEPAYDYPQVIVNGVATTMQGYNTSGSNSQSGTMTVNVTAGQIFAFNMHTNDNAFGAAIVTISNLVITNSDAIFSWAATNGGSITGATNTASMTPATSGTYTVTATNANGCTATDSVEVTINPLTTPTFTTIAPICSGSTAPTLPTTSSNNISGTWLPATVSNTTSGTYTFTPNGGQCASVTTLDITVNSLAATPTGSASQTLLETNATIANLVVIPSTSTWYASEADALTGTNPLTSTSEVTNGSTYYAVNNLGSCASLPFAVTVTVTLANDSFSTASFSFYPNPTSNVLNIEYAKNIESVSVINLLGQTLFENKTNNTNVQIDLSNLPTATYFVKVKADGDEKTVKVVKQ